MRKQVNIETKEHFKSYKAGKNWVFACLTVATLGLGMTGMSVTAHADTMPASTPQTETNNESDFGSEKSNHVPLATTSEKESSLDDSGSKDETTSNAKTGLDETSKDSDTDFEKNDKSTTNDQENNTVPEVQKESQKTPGVSVMSKNDGTPKETPDNNQTESVQQIRSFSSILPTAMVSRSALAKNTLPNITGVDATEWMPDPAMRAWVINQAKFFNPGAVITSANLFSYISNVTSLSDYNFTADLPTDFTGIQYLTNLTDFSLTKQAIAPDHMIDFSFAPNLTSLTLTVPTGTTMAPQDASTFMQTYLGQNTKLQYLYIRYYNLTGDLPDLSAYKQLINVNLDSNALTGTLANLGTLPEVLYLQLGDNQLSGAFPDLTAFPKLQRLYMTNNNFSGKLPDLSGFTGLNTLAIDGNHFTTNFNDPNLLGVWNSKQTVQGGTYKLSDLPKLATFDPLTNVLFGSQDLAGNIDTTAKYNVMNEGTLPLYFWRNADPDNPLGFVYKANGTAIPAGTYTITVATTNNYQAETTVTFTIVDDTTPVDPDPDPSTDPDTTDPTDPTIDPGTTDPVDPTEPVTPPTTGDAGDQIISDGDGDQIVTPTKPTTNDQTAHPAVTNDGAAAKIVASNGHHVTTTTASVSPVVSHHNQVTNLTATKLATSKTTHQNETTLPQTGEKQNLVSMIAAGVTVALTTLGLGLRHKRQE